MTAPTVRVPHASPIIEQRPIGFSQLSAAGVSACAVRNDGDINCWGANPTGAAPVTRAPNSGDYTQVANGLYHSCALRADGIVECWGDNAMGQAPTTKQATSGHVFTQISAAGFHTCALREDGVVECWGMNNSGQAPPTRLASSGHTFMQVTSGREYNCALRDDGIVECWGASGYGQAPALKSALNSGFTQVDAEDLFTCAVRRSDGFVECWGMNSEGQAPATVAPQVGRFTQVSVGTLHACGLRDDGVVQCWGSYVGGAGPATRAATGNLRFTQIAVSITSSCGLRNDGAIECWGDNSRGQAPAIKIATIETHILPTANFQYPTIVAAGERFILRLNNITVRRHPEAVFDRYFDCGDGTGYQRALPKDDGAACPTSVAGIRTVKGKAIDQDGDEVEYVGTVQIIADDTPPVITPTITGTLGANGWYTSNVTVTWSVTDGEAPVWSPTGCDATTITTDTPSLTLTCSATSIGGQNSVGVTIKRDATAPTLTPAVTPSTVMLNGSAAASPNADDATSGVASATCGALNTASVGAQTVSCTVTDNAGNQATKTASYTVAYQFGTFSAPIAGGTTLNVAKAGQTIPLKWRLVDAGGQPIISLTTATVSVATLSCALGTSSDAVEEYTAGASGLQNLGNGYYQYNWKTPKDYAGSCKTLSLDLGEGLTHTALFQFTK